MYKSISPLNAPLIELPEMKIHEFNFIQGHCVHCSVYEYRIETLGKETIQLNVDCDSNNHWHYAVGFLLTVAKPIMTDGYVIVSSSDKSVTLQKTIIDQ